MGRPLNVFLIISWGYVIRRRIAGAKDVHIFDVHLRISEHLSSESVGLSF